jgi:hypothetical protein
VVLYFHHLKKIYSDHQYYLSYSQFSAPGVLYISSQYQLPPMDPTCKKILSSPPASPSPPLSLLSLPSRSPSPAVLPEPVGGARRGVAPSLLPVSLLLLMEGGHIRRCKRSYSSMRVLTLPRPGERRHQREGSLPCNLCWRGAGSLPCSSSAAESRGVRPPPFSPPPASCEGAQHLPCLSTKGRECAMATISAAAMAGGQARMVEVLPASRSSGGRSAPSSPNAPAAESSRHGLLAMASCTYTRSR